MKVIIVASLAFTTSLLAIDNEPAKRLAEAASVFSEVMAAPDKGIPQDLLDKAHCVVIVPSLKTAAFLVGGKYGKGYLSCRNKSGSGWSAPGTVRIEGGSVGFQIGGSTTDLIMLVMSERGAAKLLSSKFTLGGEGSVARGPSDGQRQLKPMPKCTPRFSRGRGPRASLRVSLWRALPCGRIWMTTLRSTAGNWRTGKS
jgi:lipid-binding SYLF domain-containing protein